MTDGALPTVVLAGRPNTGKSTLFNRLLHKRRAITDPTPGVTRDPVAADTVILGRPLRLIDTGGFKLDRLSRDPDSPEGSLDRIVVERSLAAIRAADLVILLLEAGELTPEDEEFISLLRPLGDRLIVAVNKTEGGRREAEAWNLLALGFEKIYLISAEHGDNVADLEEAVAAFLSQRLPAAEDAAAASVASADRTAGQEPPAIKIALLGKPNTGKSSLSNRLTARAASIVSAAPGTTRDVIEGSFTWKGRKFQTLDTAGIRRRGKVRENIEYYSVNRAIKTIDEADIVFLIIDAVEGLAEQDKKIAALAHNKGRGVILALNKWDLMPTIKNTFEAVRDRVRFLFPKMEYAPVIAISALDGTGVDSLLDTAVQMYGQLTRHIETSTLNQALERWTDEYPPPSGPRTRFKIRYAVQVSANPVRFVIFVSRKQAAAEHYIAYIRNCVRRDLGFSLVPVEIEVRGSPARNES